MLYSHDSWGLGHLRRNLAIARALSQALTHCSIVIVSGSPCATQFRLPRNTDIVKIPAISKDADGAYQPRNFSTSMTSVLALRRSIIEAVYRSFEPHVLLVDHAATGLGDELIQVLRWAQHSQTKCLYGIRDVLDNTERTEAGWSSPASQWALAEGYQRILVYGERRLFDTVQRYPTLRALAHKVRHVGLIANGPSGNAARNIESPHVLVTAGGGEDGFDLLCSYLTGIRDAAVPWHSSVVSGPLLPPAKYAQLRELADSIDSIRLYRFHKQLPSLMAASNLVVSMAGYNSCSEILDSRCPSVLVPRTFPRQEQLLRAGYLDAAGLAQSLVQPNDALLIDTVADALRRKRPCATTFPQLNGARNIVKEIHGLLGLDEPPTAHVCLAKLSANV